MSNDEMSWLQRSIPTFRVQGCAVCARIYMNVRQLCLCVCVCPVCMSLWMCQNDSNGICTGRIHRTHTHTPAHTPAHMFTRWFSTNKHFPSYSPLFNSSRSKRRTSIFPLHKEQEKNRRFLFRLQFILNWTRRITNSRIRTLTIFSS